MVCTLIKYMFTRSIKARWLPSKAVVVPGLESPGILNGNRLFDCAGGCGWAGARGPLFWLTGGGGTVPDFFCAGAGVGAGCAAATTGASARQMPIKRAGLRML